MAKGNIQFDFNKSIVTSEQAWKAIEIISKKLEELEEVTDIRESGFELW